MIQVQNGRLHYNWIRRQGGAYVRYPQHRPKLDQVLSAFRTFLREEGLCELNPNQWEVTYVNHIPKGTVWESPADWVSLFAGLPAGAPPLGVADIESIQATWHYVIPDRRGRLHVDTRLARDGGDPPRDLLRVALTARGPASTIEGGESSTLADGLELGRRVIVQGFPRMFSESAHSFWGLES